MRRGNPAFVLLQMGLCVTAPVLADWSPEVGGLFTRSFTPKAYQASPQNWAAVEDRRGVMYFGNTEGVLEYDGVSWRRIPVSNGSTVRALATDPSGRVYVGAQGEFGYLKPDEHGTLRYVSLLDRVPPDARKFTDVWNVLPAGDAVYFGTLQGLYRWSSRQNSIRVWKPAKRFGWFFWVDGTVYVAAAGAGLLRLRGDAWEAVPGGANFSLLDVRGVLRGPGGLLVLTRTAVYRHDGTVFHKMTGAIDSLLAERQVYGGWQLADGRLVLATARAGLVLLNPDGSLARTRTKADGLLSDYITSIFRDREGGVWVTTSAGIQRVELAMTQFGPAEGLSGSVYCIVRHEGRIYAGTDIGLFALGTAAGAAPRFEAVPNIKISVYALTPTAHGLLVGTQYGVYRLAGGRATQVLTAASVFDIGVSLRDNGTVYAAGRYGIQKLRWEGSGWKSVAKLPAGGPTFRSVAEDADGRTWVATQNDIYRVDWTKKEPASERFGLAQGIPAGFKNLYRLGGGVVVSTEKGLLQFDPVKSVFVPWTGFGGQFADGSRPVSIVAQTPQGSAWITGKGYHGLLDASRQRWHPMPLLRSGQAELYAVFPEADGVVWAAGPDGFLVRYDPTLTPPAPPLQVAVRQVQAQDGFVPFGGAGTLASPPRLAWARNTLRFEFAAPFQEDPAAVEYQTRLHGADSAWSQWRRDPYADYTHLFEGRYTFLVRARNPHGVVSGEASFAFTVLPPWYRTWWALVAYALMVVGGVWGLVRWRVRKLELEKAKLEIVVEERTAEIRRQRDQIQLEEQKTQSLLLNILPASVAEELKGTGAVQPQHYDSVTVCFTDFVGFSLSSQQLSAEELVSSLHEYFTGFDELAQVYGLEKLKTIGDSYMLVSGLPEERASHAVDAVLGALEMAAVVRELASRGNGAAWDVRIGLHSGPVTAGVVGVRKFAFDIWGNTVNMASRMESSGAPGFVNISWGTYEEVKDFFECESRGHVRTKDKLDYEMYFVRGLRSDLRDPEAFNELYRDRFGDYPAYDIGARGTLAFPSASGFGPAVARAGPS